MVQPHSVIRAIFCDLPSAHCPASNAHGDHQRRLHGHGQLVMLFSLLLSLFSMSYILRLH